MTRCLLFALVAAICLAATSLPAQSHATAEQGVRLQTYVLGTFARPDYEGGRYNAGITAGADINVFRFFGRVDPSLDLRFLGTIGGVSHQYFTGIGPRVVLDFGRIRPYAEFLLGDGVIHFVNPPDPNYTHDNCLAKAYGGGFDVLLTRDFALRAEFLQQSWQLSIHTPTFHPQAALVGVRYQLHFRGKGGPDL